jgi:hypothetical protein
MNTKRLLAGIGTTLAVLSLIVSPPIYLLAAGVILIGIAVII